MDKILISVYVLSLDEHYDLFVPINLKATQFVGMLQKLIYELSGENYVIQNEVRLIEQDTGQIINLNNIIKYSGIKNGSKLLLL